MKITRVVALLLIFSLCFTNIGCGQEAPPDPGAKNVEAPALPELDAMTIAEMYKDTLVDIQTVVTRENGMVEVWGGSGFFIDDQGTILTCCHVVRNDRPEAPGMFGIMVPVAPVRSYDYWITLNNRKYKATMLGANQYIDAAALKVLDIDPSAYKPAKLGDSDKVKTGEKVYAYGNPLDLPGTFTDGIVSKTHRQITGADNLWYVQDFIQTNTPINPGNSGGPLINSRGEVIGINAGTYPGYDGLHLAVSIKLANPRKLMADGVVKMAYLGADVMLDNFARTGVLGDPGFSDMKVINDLTGIDNRKSLELLADMTYPAADNGERRSMVIGVDAKSPADIAGLKRGDIITHFNGVEVKNGRDVRLLTLDIGPDKEFEVKVTRVEKGVAQELTLKMKLMVERPKTP